MSCIQTSSSAPEVHTNHKVSGQTWTAIAVLFLLLRLFATAQWNWDSAFSILQSINLSDALPLIFSTVMGDYRIATLILLVTYPLLLIRNFWPGAYSARTWSVLSALILLVLGIILITLVKTFHQWWVLAVMVLITLVLVGLYLYRNKSSHNQPVNELLTKISVHTAKIFMVLILVVAVLSKTPWVPLERIQSTKGDTILGYVLEVQPGFLHVLDSDTRITRFINSGDVLSRIELEEDEYEKNYLTLFKK